MYICSCRALTDKDVNNAIREGASRPSAVYKTCGSKPECGRCVKAIVNLIKEHSQKACQT
ncbi:hypothetical protein COMNV_01129 [Commensalibacter sp. Nvir]|uniref:(2Fe-2S)-binding protein n=1 Tax=Commensalibacter sp. Nvir TaxID=3069817 RepID=UPI002D6B7664|nr:hypothetical protein COMNV_01129 [Commensalibacter sp. Nvir]